MIARTNICKDHQVNSIFISSLVCCNSAHLNRKIKSFNVILEKLCQSNRFIFINNSNITEMGLADDDLHLKESGKCILANNFVNGLNRILWNEEACTSYYELQNEKI